MSDKKQRRLLKIGEKCEKRRDGNDLMSSYVSKPAAPRCTLPEIGNGQLMKRNTGNIVVRVGDVHDVMSSCVSKPAAPRCTLPEIGNGQLKKRNTGNIVVRVGDVCDVMSSCVSKPAAPRCILPEIGNGQLMKRNTGNIVPQEQQNKGSGETVSTHLPPLPVKSAAQQQVRRLSKRSPSSSLWLALQHSQQDRHGFEKLPKLPAVVKQDCSNKESSQLKMDRLTPLHLPPTRNKAQFSSSRPTKDLDNLHSLLDIRNAQIKHSGPKSGNLHKLTCVLPDRRGELHKNLKLPQTANRQSIPVWAKQRNRGQ